MTPLSIRVTLLAGIAAIAMTLPAAASLTTSASTLTRQVQTPASQQYAQVPTDRAAGIPGLNYKSKKSKSAKSKSKKTDTSGQASDDKTKK
jgi:hypothetical protein